MRITNTLKQKTGFSMVEVVVAASLFALAAAGIFATVTSVNKPATESAEETTAAYIAKDILDGWRKEVDSTTWGQNSNPLTKKNWTTLSPLQVGNITYTPRYKVEDDPNVPNVRKVTLEVEW